ncbi:hypothetical protein CC78DRAFT_539316 [Lojkania enalia]|uniref:Uncharacterized protein n=1 Tax=Lojkania enalia TaxID=147567 RepID=A0A9P4TPG9_9PLEO|nr:hypothetical protein CC78DRAFT_539316 [Didymosphaeria enalia]
MILKNFLVAAVLAAPSALADFLIITEAPVPTSVLPTNPPELTSWLIDHYPDFLFAWGSFTRAQGEPYKSSRSSYFSALSAFVSTAPANLSIPAIVTESTTTTTISSIGGSAPSWYSAMPTDIRSYKELEVSQQAVIFAQAAGVTPSDASIPGVTQPSRTSNPAAAPTGPVGLGAGLALAAGAAAVFL